MFCILQVFEPERPANAVQNGRFSKAFPLALALRKIENPTPHRADGWGDADDDLPKARAPANDMQAAQMMFQTYEQTSLLPPLFYSAQAEARRGLRLQWWAVAHSFRRQKGCIVRVCLADRLVVSEC